MIVSVVTPSFNQGCYLAETIESVLRQAGDFHIDYIVMDGGSSDDSVEIIKRYEALLLKGDWPVKCRGIKFRWSSGKDRGQTDSLRKGFRLAEGEVLAWLNSDDIYLAGTLQTVATFFQDSQKTALVYGDSHYCDSEGKIIGRYPTEEFDLGKLAWSNFFCQPSTFFRKETFAAVGGLDESLHFAMDYDLFVRMAIRFDCHYLPQFLSKYRLHEEAKTMRNDVLFENHEETLRVTLKYFKWAPLNRVYGSCNYYCLARLPVFLTRVRSLVIVLSGLCTIFRSLWLNRGLRREDLKLLGFSNLRKIFKNRMEILRGEIR